MGRNETIKNVKQYPILLYIHSQLENVYLCGSYALGTNREESDIDVAIVACRISEVIFEVNPLLWKLR